MSILLDGTGGVTTPGVVNTAGETIATTLAVTGVSTFAAGTALLPALTTTGDTNTGLWFPAADTVAASTGGTERMRIDSSGNVGIGNTAPADRLQIEKANANCLLSVSRTTGGAGGRLVMQHTDSVGALQTTASVPLCFGTNDTERMRIDSSGNLLVGTTSTFSGTSFYQASSGIYAAYFRQANASSPVGLLVNYSGASPNGTANVFFEGNDTTTARVALRSNGGIANYSANNVNLSDRREKTNFAPAGEYLSKICAIPVQTFNYIDQNMEEDGGLTLGVVAQDVQDVAPEMVMESNWGTEEEPKMRLSIYQTDLQYALMKCIQEQQALIIQLQADVATLKALSA